MLEIKKKTKFYAWFLCFKFYEDNVKLIKTWKKKTKIFTLKTKVSYYGSYYDSFKCIVAQKHFYIKNTILRFKTYPYKLHKTQLISITF